MLFLFLAQTPAASPSAPGSGLLSMLPFVFLIVIMYYVMIRPQMRRQKEQQKLVTALKTGDRVVTSSGIQGLIANVKETMVIVKVVGKDRILVQIPGLSTEKIQEARQQLSRVAKLEFKMVYPDNGDRLRAIDSGTDVVPPEYKIETYTPQKEENGKKVQSERLLVKKKSDLGGEHVSGSNAYFGNEGWGVQLRFDSEGGKTFGDITEKSKGFRFAIVLDGAIQSAPVIREAIYGGSAQITGRFTEQEARGLASVLENPLQTPVSIEEERSVSPTLGLDSIRASIMAGLIGLAITLVFVLIYYQFVGVIACLALLVNI